MSMAFDENDGGPQQQNQEPVVIKDEICWTLKTNDDNFMPNCKAMSGFPITFDEYLKNKYYFQFRIEENFDEQVNTQPGNFWKSAVKLGSMG